MSTIVANNNPDLVVLSVSLCDDEVCQREEPIVAWRITDDDGTEAVTTQDREPASNQAFALYDRRTGRCWSPGAFNAPGLNEGIAELTAEIRLKLALREREDRLRFVKSIA